MARPTISSTVSIKDDRSTVTASYITVRVSTCAMAMTPPCRAWTALYDSAGRGLEYGAADGGIENVTDVGGSNNLFEDIASFGFARKTLAVGARGGQGPNTVRRAWVEHNGSPYGSAEGNPTDPVDLGYNQDNVTMENVIGRRNILSSATSPKRRCMPTPPATVPSSAPSCMPPTRTTSKTHMMLNITAESGSHAGPGTSPRTSWCKTWYCWRLRCTNT